MVKNAECLLSLSFIFQDKSASGKSDIEDGRLEHQNVC